MTPPVMTFDISSGDSLATWIFQPPPETPVRRPVLFCFPGGSYSKAYWHLEVPGHPGYSCAEHLASRGFTVVAVDHLGVGQSTRPPGGSLTPERVAGANAELVTQALERLEIDNPIAIAVGHSMGGMLSVYQQSIHRSFAAIAVLGYPHGIMELHSASPTLPTREQIEDAAAAGALDEPTAIDRRPMHRLFHWEDVPTAVIEADDAAATATPGLTGAISIVPYIAADHASRIDVPVFIAFGQRDNARDPLAEVAAYRSATDVSLLELPRSGHCHNFASTRTMLWDRLADWAVSATRTIT